jgi:hypothetical protein
MDLDSLINKVEKIAAASTKFKIGETGRTLDGRFDTKYQEGFSQINQITWSTNKELIDVLEDELIKYFRRKYPRKCKNLKDGSAGEMTDINGRYKIYVVSTPKPIKPKKR